MAVPVKEKLIDTAWLQQMCRAEQQERGESRYKILSNTKETTPRSILLPSSKHKNLCTNILRNTSLDSVQLCTRAALRRYDEQPRLCFQTKPQIGAPETPSCIGGWEAFVRVRGIILTRCSLLLNTTLGAWHRWC